MPSLGAHHNHNCFSEELLNPLQSLGQEDGMIRVIFLNYHSNDKVIENNNRNSERKQWAWPVSALTF